MILKYTWQFFIFSNICSYCQKIKITINLILSLEEAATISYKGLLLSFYTTQYLTNRLDYPNTQTGTGSGSHTNFLSSFLYQVKFSIRASLKNVTH